MIKGIIFDCFGVLTTDTWKEFCATLPAGSGLQKAREINREFNSAQISREQFISGVQKATGYDPSPYIGTYSDEYKNVQLLSYISELKKDYKIGLLSNVADNWIKDVLLSVEEQDLFDDMVFSYDVGMVKPDPRIYEITARNLGLDCADIVLIDDIDRYCAGAEAVGMKAIVYRDFPQMKEDLRQILSQS